MLPLALPRGPGHALQSAGLPPLPPGALSVTNSASAAASAPAACAAPTPAFSAIPCAAATPTTAPSPLAGAIRVHYPDHKDLGYGAACPYLCFHAALCVLVIASQLLGLDRHAPIPTAFTGASAAPPVPALNSALSSAAGLHMCVRGPLVIVSQSAGLGGRNPSAVLAAAFAAAPGPSSAAPPAAVAAATAPALPICQSFEPPTTFSAAARSSLCTQGVTAPCCAVAATSVVPSDPSSIRVVAAARLSLCATGVTAPRCSVAATSVGSTVRAIISPFDAPPTFPFSTALSVTLTTALGFSVSTYPIFQSSKSKDVPR